jgi:alkylmercury lyase
VFGPFVGELPSLREDAAYPAIGDAVDHVAPRTLRCREAAPPQTRKVIGDPSPGRAGRVDQFADRARTFQQEVEQGDAGRVRQHREQPRQRPLLLGSRGHDRLRLHIQQVTLLHRVCASRCADGDPADTMTEPEPGRDQHGGRHVSLDGRVDSLIDALESGLPGLDAVGRSVALELYRGLARGESVSNIDLATRTGHAADDIAAVVRSWRDVVRDDQGRVIGFWGLTIEPTAHSFDTDAAYLYTWCAWDTLFLPAILDLTARVSSIDPQSGEPVRLTVSPTGIVERSHPDIVVSFVVPEGDACASDVRSGFCQHVHFFSNQQNGRRWIGGRGHFFTLDLDAAHHLGQRRNQVRGLA